MDRRRFGLALLVVGGLVWPLGLYLGFQPQQILGPHLILVLSGVYLRGSKILRRLRHQPPLG